MKKVERRRLWLLAAGRSIGQRICRRWGGAVKRAVHDLGLFELDNNALNDLLVAGDDWDNVLLGSGGASIDNTGVLVDPAGQTIFTTGGSKDDLNTNQWRHSSGSVPDKDDITDAYAASYAAADGDRVVYFGMDRFAQNGSSNIGFWFFQSEMGLNVKRDLQRDAAHGGGCARPERIHQRWGRERHRGLRVGRHGR